MRSLGMNIKQAFLFGTAFVMVLSTISGNSASAAGLNVLPDEASWYRKQLIDGEVKPRLQYGLAPNGFYRPYLARDWQPKREQQGTLISQTRAIYVMAAGYEVTGERVYYDAMIKAADFLLENYADKKVPGRWVNLVGPDGKVLATQFHAHGYAHVIFALTHASRVKGQEILGCRARHMASARPAANAPGSKPRIEGVWPQLRDARFRRLARPVQS
jgi:N-acylglucosamine 2-epimerase (GlcNAc 2-epimerase)